MLRTDDAPTVSKPDNSIRPVPLLDIGRQNSELETEILEAIARVCKSGHFVMGPECQQLESRIAEYCGTKHAIGCASGSDALLLALIALGIERGDEVILPSFTFFATASCVWRLGAKPVFVDIEPDTFNISPQLVEAAITDATKAIIPVHLFGQSADMDAIMSIAKNHNLFVVEDAAQAVGARYRDRPVGSIGDVGCISFYPTKNLGGFGDGGMLTTSNDDLADRLRHLRSHGMSPRYYHQEVGINSRLDSIQAAALNVKFPRLDDWSRRRAKNAARYNRLLTDSRLQNHIQLPVDSDNSLHVWNQYTIRVKNGKRNLVREHLTSRGIGSEIYYPIPLHVQECFRGLGYRIGSLPETERAASEVLSLPIFPELTAPEQDIVVNCLLKFFAATAAAPTSHFMTTNVAAQAS